ncbi:WASH complex subunit 5 isoform X2 [Leptopilina boulardi]|uniref:WASH complex subunit 5 isoform X2 n=1 Tax=Leptopilina boulardi TaxID=63433 RepID=UPI0021F51BEA|nr:WASH complex subunit 5 isoform X2 [Leptopilina boulardi]
MGDFIASNNVCGQNLLRLVSRGNAVIAELMRLKDYIPPVYRLDSKSYIQKYSLILIDFAYFKTTNACEERIENDSNLQSLDEELRNSYSQILLRFYLAFESIHKYITELNAYVDELEEGVYIQQSVESIMLNEEGKQLMCESIYLYGIMLLLVDFYFEGPIRERLLVSYYRYNAHSSSSTRVDDVCMLLRSTGFIKLYGKRAPNYPESFFQRVSINSSFIDLVIARLRSDELYSQSVAFPHPEHRSVALANQASMLVVILAFKPSILHNQPAIMREIVDRFFPDTWAISVYMGIVIDLWDWWAPYKAARSALNNTLEINNVKIISQKHGQAMEKQILKTEEVKTKVTLDESTLGSVIKLIRDCNVTLHWILLHTALPTYLLGDLKKSRSLRQMVIQESNYTINNGLRLLLSSAQIEHEVKQLYKTLLIDKEAKWLKNKETAVERIRGLAEIFGGQKLFDGIDMNHCLEAWFKEISKHVATLQEEDGRKIPHLLQALEEVQEFHQLENNLHISQHLNDTRDILHNMLHTSNVTEDTLITLNIVTDCCYAWNIMESFIPIMQENIKANPLTVIKLKALFLKMASALETPLLRVNQARSTDLSSVSQYYSRELESFARQVLQIIPETVFGILAQIVHLETNFFTDIPTKLYKDKIKDYGQLNERLKNPLMDKLQKLANVMDGYRKSFQYIQDYININSLKVWHEEVTYIIDNAVEEECRGSTWTPGKVWTYYQDEKISSHTLQSDSNSVTFMGRLAHELIRITDPKTTVYIEHTLAWYDLRNQTEIIDHKVFSMILKAMGTPGLSRLDKMISFYVAVELENLVQYVNQGVKNKTWKTMLKECEVISKNLDSKNYPGRLYSSVNTYVSKIWSPLLDSVLKIGNMQLLRHLISFALNTECKFEAKHMEGALKTLNEAILGEIQRKNTEAKSDYVSKQKRDLLLELSVRLEWAGITDSMKKCYIEPPSINNMSFIMFLLTVIQIHKLYFCKNTASLLSKKVQDPVDSVILSIGVQTVLQQFEESQLMNYVSYVCDYIVSFTTLDSSKLTSEWEMEGVVGLHYLELFSNYAHISKSIILNIMPFIVLEQQHARIIK